MQNIIMKDNFTLWHFRDRIMRPGVFHFLFFHKNLHFLVPANWFKFMEKGFFSLLLPVSGILMDSSELAELCDQCVWRFNTLPFWPFRSQGKNIRPSMLISHEHWNLRQLGERGFLQEGKMLSSWVPKRREVSLTVQWEEGGLRQRGAKRLSEELGHLGIALESLGREHGIQVRDNHGASAGPAGVVIPVLSAGFLAKSWSGSSLVVCGVVGMVQSPLQQELDSIHLSKNSSYSKYPSQRQWELFCFLIRLIKHFPATDIVPLGHESTKSTGWDPKRRICLLHHVPEALKSVS